VAGLSVISVLPVPKASAVIPEQLIFGITNKVTQWRSISGNAYILSRLAKK
jgi:hypothetical protein